MRPDPNEMGPRLNNSMPVAPWKTVLGWVVVVALFPFIVLGEIWLVLTGDDR